MKKILVLVAVLALVAVMVVPLAASAASPPGQVTIVGTGNVPTSISLTLTAPTSGINFGAFHMGLNDWQSTDNNGSVAFNPGIDTAASWSLWVYSGDYAGQDYSLGAMYSADCASGARYLTNPMTVAFTGTPPGAALPGGISMLDQTAISTTFGLSGQQTISLADAQAGQGNYSIVIQLYAQVNY